MAYKSLVITPTQYSEQAPVQRSQFYRGFSTVDDTKTDTRLYDFDLIKQDLLNEFNVRKNERVMYPTFGCVIWDLLYEPFTDAVKEQISEDVTRIVTSDPRLNVLQVNVVEQEYGLILELTLLYAGSDQTENMKLTFDKKVGLSAG